MRILMLSEFYPPIIGGMERHVQMLARELVQRGHDVAVVTLQLDGLPVFEVDEGVRVYRINGLNKFLSPFYQSKKLQYHPPMPDPIVMIGLQRIIAQEQPELVHARRWMLYSFIGLKAWSGAKLVVTLHDYSLDCAKMTYVHDNHSCTGPSYAKCISCASAQYGWGKAALLTTGLKLSSSLHKYVDKYIAVSSVMRNVSMSKDMPRAVEIVPSFILNNAEDEANGADRPSFLPTSNNYILFVGRLATYKGLNILLEAYRDLTDLAPLVLLGTGSTNSLINIPDGVVVVQDVPHAQVMASWKHCAVGVVPSIWPEPFGQVAVEAMTCGKPIVASATGGILDIVMNGETGLLIEPGNVNALRDALRTLLLDPVRREQMGNAGRERAKMFTVGTVTDRVEEIYHELLDNRNVKGN